MMITERKREAANCPINEQTADGIPVGRCWFYLPDGKTCPRHGDVSSAVDRFKRDGHLTPESQIERRGVG